MKYLICGLGNIGPEYQNTRHNVGFMINDLLAEQHKVGFEMGRHAFYTHFSYRSRQIHLIKPTTFMNLSGKAVGYWLQELKIPAERLLVLVDDLAIPYGTLRMRAKGSAAGHNGLGNIEQQLQSSAYPRLRFGIGDSFPKGRQVDFVLSDFTAQEKADLPDLLMKSAEMALSFCSIGISRTMTQFNK